MNCTTCQATMAQIHDHQGRPTTSFVCMPCASIGRAPLPMPGTHALMPGEVLVRYSGLTGTTVDNHGNVTIDQWTKQAMDFSAVLQEARDANHLAAAPTEPAPAFQLPELAAFDSQGLARHPNSLVEVTEGVADVFPLGLTVEGRDEPGSGDAPEPAGEDAVAGDADTDTPDPDDWAGETDPEE